MKRTLPRLLLLIMLASSTVSAAVSHKVFQKSTSANPIVIAILADHYTDDIKFENDVKNFITYGLLAHPYYAAHANDLQIETFYEAVATGEASKYGFNVEVPSQNCVMSWEVGATQATNTWLKISAVVAGINPRHTIVIGDHPYSIGCTDGEWTYIGEDAAGTDMLAHELGHGIGQLHDEWTLAPNANLPHPGMSADPEIARNCHHLNNGTTPAPPWTLPGAASHSRCDLYGLQIVHPYNHMTTYGGHKYCLMGATSNAEFCPVCKHYMDQEFAYLENPDAENPNVSNPDIENPETHNPLPPPPQNNPRNQRPVPPPPPSGVRIIQAAFVQDPKPIPPPVPPPVPVPPPPSPPIALVPAGATGPIVRLIVSLNPVNGAIAAKKAFPITARYAPNRRRLGQYAYEILNGDQVLDVGVVPSNLFRSNNYQGGSGHLTSDPHVADVTIQIPGVSGEMLKDPARSFSIKVWWLSPAVTDKVITPAKLNQLKEKNLVEQRGTLTPAQIREAM